MLPGPTLVLRCPSCGGRFLRETLMSGNNFGARLWSDGYTEAPMLPSLPPFVTAPCCSKVVRLDDAEELEELPGPLLPVDLDPSLDYLQGPTVQELVAALPGLPEADEHRGLLLEQLWHCANDPRRDAPPGPVGDLPSAILPALTELLDFYDTDVPSNRLGRAELLRELGRFDEALEILDGLLDSGRRRAGRAGAQLGPTAGSAAQGVRDRGIGARQRGRGIDRQVAQQ